MLIIGRRELLVFVVAPTELSNILISNLRKHPVIIGYSSSKATDLYKRFCGEWQIKPCLGEKGPRSRLCAMPTSISSRYLKTSPEIIQLAVMLFSGFSLLIGTAFRTTFIFSLPYNYLKVNDIFEKYGCAPGHHVSKQNQRLNSHTLTLCVFD